MRTVSFIHSGLVGAQIDKVFDLLTDPARVPDWLPGCQTVKRVDGPPGKGQRWRLRMQTPFRIADLVVEVIEYAPPTGFAWAELQPRSGSKTYFKLAFAGGATEVTMKHLWAPPSLTAWLRGVWFRRRHIQHQFDGSLQSFRKLLTR